MFRPACNAAGDKGWGEEEEGAPGGLVHAVRKAGLAHDAAPAAVFLGLNMRPSAYCPALCLLAASSSDCIMGSLLPVRYLTRAPPAVLRWFILFSRPYLRRAVVRWPPLTIVVAIESATPLRSPLVP